jgi:hypothetical protein
MIPYDILLGTTNRPMDERYLEERKAIEHFFTPENKVADSGETVVSPSGHYELEISGYFTGPNHGEFSRGVVRRLSDNKVIADVKRNYSHFWHAWVKHPNGNEYLLCGEDYQGYSVINLTQETCDVYFPESGYAGMGFCWVSVYPSPDGLALVVNGCYWASTYEFVFFDFSNPASLPLPEIERYRDGYGPVIGWVDNETFIFTRPYEVRESDGTRYMDLSEDERALIDKDYSQLEEDTQKYVWTRFGRNDRA